jgi:CheY-like chemotaxis protein
MPRPLRILHLEDNPADTLLVRDQFAQDELAAEVHHVANREGFITALKGGQWDLVIADYRIPDYNGLDALKLVRKTFPNLPFILMSGTIGEHAAVERPGPPITF